MGATVPVVLAAISAAFAAMLYMLPVPAPLEQVKGQRVVITGASSGVGAALAGEYARLGANLLLTGRREAPLRQVAERCRRFGALSVTVLRGDMTDPGHRARLEAEAGRQGGIDQLLLSHADYSAAPWLGSAQNLTSLGAAMDANFVSHADLAVRALPLLRAAGGRLGVVSSLHARAPQPLLAGYSASKAAQRSYFAALRQELTLAGANVSVTTFLLGGVTTAKYTAVQERHYHWVNLLGAASAEEAAAEIVRGVMRRDTEVVYPVVARVQQMLHAVLPEIYEYNWNMLM